MNVDIWNSLGQLRSHADDWDALWQRSSAITPVARAEPLAIWLESFSRPNAFRAIVVQDGNKLVAALPLHIQRRFGCFPVGRLPQNGWSTAGELLIDPSCIDEATLGPMIAALKEVRCVSLNLGKVDSHSAQWRPLFKRLASQHLLWRYRRVCQVGCVRIQGSWENYMASRSRNHRQQVRKHLRRICEQGELALKIVKPRESTEIEELLRRGFEVEDHSWKGDAGTSVLRNPEIFQFFCQQAEALSRLDHLWLVFLEFDGKPIAFEYGWHAKDTYFSPKVGYDEAFARFSPGQLLRHELLKQFHESPGPSLVNYWGPLTPATERWTTHCYTVVDSMMMPNRTAAGTVRKLASSAASMRHAIADVNSHLRQLIPGKPAASTR